MSDTPPSLECFRHLLTPTFCEDTCYEVAHTWTPSCLAGSLGVFYSIMQESFKIYPPIYFITALLRKEKFEYFTKRFFQDVLQSSLTIAVNGSGFLAGVCLSRKILGGFFYLTMALIPALLASFLAINVERKERQGMLALYMFNNAIEMVYNALKKRGLIIPIPLGEVWIFCITTAVMMYQYRKDDGLKRGALKSLISFFVGTKRPEDVQDLTDASSEAPQVYSTIGKESMSLDCIKHCLKAFIVGYGLQLLTQLPTIFKKPRSIMRSLSHPENFQCGLFLGSYVGIFKVVEYLMAWYRNKQDSMNTIVAGGLSGLSMMFYRSSTIALYLATKVGEILYKRGIKQGIVPVIPNAVVWIYTVCTAMVFHSCVFDVETVRASYWIYLNKVTHRRFCEINRQRLDDYFKMDVAKYFPVDDLYQSLRRR